MSMTSRAAAAVARRAATSGRPAAGRVGGGVAATRFAPVSRVRDFHVTSRKESATPLVVGTGIAAIAYAGKIVLEAIDKRQAAQAAAEAAKADGTAEAKAEHEPSWASWLSFSLGKRFYEGGFEEEMTRREAALILGIRESAPREKVREAHRRLALLNHPDTGGSTFVSSKINEAKEKLLGSR